MEDRLFNTQIDQAMIICANAMALQVPELKKIDIKSPTEVILAQILELEAEYPEGIALYGIEKSSYSLNDPVEGYIAMANAKD